MTCDKCGKELRIGMFPFCPHGTGLASVVGDECDIVQENGFHEPTRFTSKRELTRALAEKGLEMRVRHVTIPGTDRSPYTTDWSRGCVDLEAARVLVTRPSERASGSPKDSDVTVPVVWTIRDVE